MMDIESKYNVEEEKKKKKKEEEGEWEEVKKGGKRMKQVNDISNFKTSMLGSVFEGIIKVDVLEKGNSLSKCQIEPFFVLSLNVDGNTNRRHVPTVLHETQNRRHLIIKSILF